MAYEADISRANPACFLFLVDQSASMAGPIGNSEELKMDVAANVLNRTLSAVVERCSQGVEIREYFDIGILTYTTNAQGFTQITSVLPGTSSEEPFLKISAVAEAAEVIDKPVWVSDGAGGLTEIIDSFPQWLEPTAEHGTPIVDALRTANAALGRWIAQHQDSYPPILINITDGLYTIGGNPEPVSTEIMGLSTTDGNVLLFNAHLSERSANPVQYPSLEEGLPGEDAELLFRMSSPLPRSFCDLAGSLGISVAEGARGYVYNAGIEELVHFLDIGTRGPAELH